MGELLLEIKENEVETIIGMFEIKILFIFVLSFKIGNVACNKREQLKLNKYKKNNVHLIAFLRDLTFKDLNILYSTMRETIIAIL